MSGQMTWEDPPEKHPYDWVAISERLKKNPGRWLKIFDRDRHSLATAIRLEGIAALRPSDGFEVKTRNNVRGEPRTCTLYLRYNPKE